MMKTTQDDETEKKQPVIRLVTLSTCFFCSKVKRMLDKEGFDYTYTDLDLMPEEERDAQLSQIKKFNPEESFPIVIINNIAIVGYQEERIKQELGIL
jgi:glutaredoxin-like protein NrdH